VIEGWRLSKQSPTVLSYETPGSRKPGSPPPPPWYRRSLLWVIARRFTFVLGMALLGMGIGGGIEALHGPRVISDAQAYIGWGMALIGVCIPLGPLPWFMREDESRG
jgi:hypothetical protein